MKEEMMSTREVFAKTLVELGKENENIVAVVADSRPRVGAFVTEFPERFFDLGIAEQDMIGVAAGLALSGKIPFAAAIAVFISLRCCEQVRTDVAYPRLNVKIVGTESGLNTGTLASTHHSLEDIAIMRAIPEMTVIVPADGIETQKATRAIAEYRGPVYLRIGGADKIPVVYKGEYNFAMGKAVTLREGGDITIIATGTMVAKALAAAEMLVSKGIGTRVINMHTIKPIDREAIVKAAKETRGIVTVEEHNIFGGLGSAVAEVVVEEALVPMRRIGVNDTWCVPGAPEALYEKYGLTPENISRAALELLGKKRVGE